MDPTHLEHLEERQPERSDPRLAHETDAQPRRSEAPLSPGGLTCRRCGADNKPEAGFCRQCGASLREAVVVPVPPWWRQLLGRTKPAALPAGSRPRWRKQKTISTGTVSFLTVLGLFAGAAFLGRDVIRVSVLRAVDEIWEKPVEVQSKTGSKTLPGHEVELAFDRTVRSWEPDGSVPPGTAYLQAGFGEPLRLTYVVITCGASQNPQGGLATVEIIAAGDGGNRSSRTVTLHENEAGPQSFYIGADRITTVRLNILKRSNPAAEPLSVAEVQFAGRT